MPREKPASDSPLWKDRVDRRFLQSLAETIRRAHRPFDSETFVDSVMADRLTDRELKDRIATIARHLRDYLPQDYSEAVDILISVAPEARGFANWVLTGFVEQFGLDNLDDSIRALKELTKYGSSEFAIRPFIIRYTREMLPILTAWTADPDENVRRLAAEGCRPRGVWTAHIESFRSDPAPVLKILENLKADDSLYVRKAVANNLNDISKDHPDLVLKTALRWRKNKNPHTDWIIKRACRSLIKLGHPEVFDIFGYTSRPRIELRDFKVSKRRIAVGEDVRLSFKLKSRAATKQKLVIDYRVHYVKKNGGTGAKVFKLTEKTLAPNEIIALSTAHSFQERSTRRHQPGTHRIELLINGVPFGESAVVLRA